MVSPSLSVFFPCYNDARTIGRLVAQADGVAAQFTRDYELIVVDDGSRDGSRELLQDLSRRYPRLRLVLHDRNRGYGAALLSGFRSATKEWVFYTDGDGQYDVQELEALLKLAGHDVDVVYGYRTSRSDPRYRIAIGWLYQRLVRKLFDIRIRDLSCDFRLIRRRALAAVELHRSSGAICIELVKNLQLAGFRSADCPVHHCRRPYGASQFFRARHLCATVLDILGLWRELRWEQKRRRHGSA